MSSGAPTRESGWGAYEKAQRYRQAEQARQVVKPDANDAFTYKRPKPQQQHQIAQVQAQPQQSQPQTQSSPAQPPAPQATQAQQQAQTVQPSSTPTQQQQQQQQSSQYTNDEMNESKYPSSSPTGQSGKVATTTGSPANSGGSHQVLCSVFVELFEMVAGAGNSAAPKAYGPKGVTFQRLSGNATGGETTFQLLVFAPVSKKVEFSVDINASFAFSVLPDRFASFEDASSARSWCLKFGSTEDAFNVARCYALITETRLSSANLGSGNRASISKGILKQDLTVGGNDGPTVQIGDQIKCKYSVYAYDPSTQPFYIGRILFSLRESQKFIVGQGSMLPSGGNSGSGILVEESLIGMRKKSTRLLILPPAVANAINDNAEWGPHVRTDTVLIVEVTVSNVRSSLPVNQEESFTQQQQQSQQQEFEQGKSSPAPMQDEQQQFQQYQQQQNQQPINPNQQQQQLPFHMQSQQISAPYPTQAQPSPAASAPIDESAPGVYNPPSIAAASGMDLKTRMALLANASHTNGLAPVPTMQQQQSTPTSTNAPRRESLTSTPTPAVSVDELESFLSDLSLSDLLPSFRREGVTFTELLALDAEELKQIVPLLGPRKRILAKLTEVKENRAQGGGSSGSSNTAAAQQQHQPHHTTHPAVASLFSPFGGTVPQQHPTGTYVSPNRQQQQQQAPSKQEAAPTAAATSKPTTTRNRFLSDAESDVVPTPSFSTASSKHLSQLHSQAQLDALLSSEYERGKNDTISLAKSKIQEIKDIASQKFSVIQEEVATLKQQNDSDREKAREVVQRLREEVRALTQERDSLSKSLSVVSSEKDSLSEKTQKYVAQMKAQLSSERESVRASVEAEVRGSGTEKIKDSMEQLFGLLQAKIKGKDLYEGDELMSMVKQAVKSVMKAQQQ